MFVYPSRASVLFPLPRSLKAQHRDSVFLVLQRKRLVGLLHNFRSSCHTAMSRLYPTMPLHDSFCFFASLALPHWYLLYTWRSRYYAFLGRSVWAKKIISLWAIWSAPPSNVLLPTDNAENGVFDRIGILRGHHCVIASSHFLSR